MKTKTECKNQPCQQLKLNKLLTSQTGVLLLCLAASVPAFGVPAGAETPAAGIPFSDLVATATANYHGNALDISSLNLNFIPAITLTGNIGTGCAWIPSTKLARPTPG